MRTIVADLFISLDGVVEAPDQWHFPYFDDEMGQEIGARMAAVDTMLLGRRTYEEFAAFWPRQGSDMPGADHMNATPKLVVSTTLTTLAWRNSTLITGDVAAALRHRKALPGKEIGVTGSPTLVRWLLHQGLLDELRLLVHPLVVGRGKRLFVEDGARVPLRLAESRTFSTGVLALTYTPADT